MAGNFNFGNDFDAVFPGKADNVPDFFPGIEAGVVFRPGNATEKCFAPVGTHGGQRGILADFNPPALVVAQMPVHPVQPAQTRGGNDLPDGFRRQVMAAAVQHESPPGEGCFVHMQPLIS